MLRLPAAMTRRLPLAHWLLLLIAIAPSPAVRPRPVTVLVQLLGDCLNLSSSKAQRHDVGRLERLERRLAKLQTSSFAT